MSAQLAAITAWRPSLVRRRPRHWLPPEVIAASETVGQWRCGYAAPGPTRGSPPAGRPSASWFESRAETTKATEPPPV